MVLWWASLDGPTALPGTYVMELILGKDTLQQPVVVQADPRLSTPTKDLEEQFRFLEEINSTVSRAHESIKEMRTIRTQIQGFMALIPTDSVYHLAKKEGGQIDSTITSIETQLYQTQNRSSQDPLNFPIRLTNKLAHLNNVVREGPYAPTSQAWQVKAELEKEILMLCDAGKN
ncbi:MAG: hypothetical protein IPJ06_13645 [Saprospiraceae bacterium]|nr:hypothetical protein [Saprospiraceae bacterium]